MFVLIDHGRNLKDYKDAVNRSFTVFNSSKYFWGVIGVSIMVWIYTMLWSLLLIVPGIVKNYSYSQAVYIYRDHLDQGTPVTINEAITESRVMMDGHKGELFLLQLTFIGWVFLGVIFFPILFWVMPYMQQTMANYYVNLSAAQPDEEDDDIMTIAKWHVLSKRDCSIAEQSRFLTTKTRNRSFGRQHSLSFTHNLKNVCFFLINAWYICGYSYILAVVRWLTWGYAIDFNELGESPESG